MVNAGTIVDTGIIGAPSSTGNANKARETEAQQAPKGR